MIKVFETDKSAKVKYIERVEITCDKCGYKQGVTTRARAENGGITWLDGD